MGEFGEKGAPKYLPNILGEYLSSRKIGYDKGKLMEVTAGVPQGSVLGPTLWYRL